MALGRGHSAVGDLEAEEAAVPRRPLPGPQRGLLQAWGPLSGQRTPKGWRDGWQGYEIPEASRADAMRGDADAQVRGMREPHRRGVGPLLSAPSSGGCFAGSTSTRVARFRKQGNPL